MRTVNDYIGAMPDRHEHPNWFEVEAVIELVIRETLETVASHIEKRRDKGDCPPRAHFCENYGCGTLTELADEIRSGKL